MRALGLFGAIGSKSRKGYGSLTLLQLNGWSNTQNAESYKQTITELISSHPHSNVPQYSAFSNHTRFNIIENRAYTKPLELLNFIGEELIRERSYGRNNQILNGENSERNYQDDHDEIYNFLTEQRVPEFAPKRVVFGLPHNYFFTNVGQAGVKPENYSRRASPLFFNIHQGTDGHLIAVILILKAKFLPDNEHLKINNRLVPAPLNEMLWTPIEQFLERFEETVR